MCFSSSASALTGLVGVVTAALASRWSARFALFWVVVSSMQFVELAIHLTLERCAADLQLALTLHLLLLGSLLAQPLCYAWFVAERSREVARLLYVHFAASMLLRFVAIGGYLRDGVTHDLFVPGLAPERTDLEDRIRASLFGQAFQALHYEDPASLRLMYTHPMDDGQQRTFPAPAEPCCSRTFAAGTSPNSWRGGLGSLVQ